MGAEKGSAFLLKVGDGAAPPLYATIAGLRATQLSVNGEAVNVTSKDSGGWRELLSGGGVRSVSVSASDSWDARLGQGRRRAAAVGRERVERGQNCLRGPLDRRQGCRRRTPSGDRKPFWWNDNRRGSARGAGDGHCDIKDTRSDGLSFFDAAMKPRRRCVVCGGVRRGVRALQRNWCGISATYVGISVLAPKLRFPY